MTTARLLRFLFASTLLVLAGQTFNASGQVETSFYSFAGHPPDGGYPYGGLVQGTNGSFYGTTTAGGYGSVFRISPSGSYTNLHVFVGHPSDGGYSYAGLVEGTDGNFYGTTEIGGVNNTGTVFRISPSGSYTSLYSFVGSPTDGAYPEDKLVQGTDGNFYGTTGLGGNGPCPGGCGTIFRISPSGSYTNLYFFSGYPTDGANPQAGLMQGSDGNFYGTTYAGGTSSNGTIFRISPSGSYTNLHSFSGHPPDGANPFAGLVQGSDGNFYGTASRGGANYWGTVFRISPSGSYTNLYSFLGYPGNDGSAPLGGLLQGNDGNFYGTAYYGGTRTNGTAFRISPSGTYTSLYSFGSYPGDGEQPVAGLVQGSDGNFYGTTSAGGTNNGGAIFKLTIPLAPPPWPINQITGVQPFGSDMVFNIVSIAGETYQLQFSSSMNPTNWVNIPGVSVTNSIGALLTLTNFGGAVGPQGFYRFAITP
ncbi:MAG TPA: choice-of-anchor tandem repeat GloVer-containing protein [Verrucomicrobiae bacterium]|nr:choice-of-anchor tandem repeat GloVer-containing protein [Verrucomicrobiae bacterium]